MPPLSIPSEDAWARARDRYVEGLSAEERTLYENATPATLLYDASAAEKRHGSQSNSRKLMEKLQPLISSIEAFGTAFDVYANTFPLALSPLWGSIRIVLYVARQFGRYFEKIVEMLARIGDVLPQLRDYVQLFSKHERLQQAISLVYVDIIEFCSNAKELFRQRRILLGTNLAIGMKLLWKPFAQNFEDQMVTLREHRRNADKEAGISHLIEASDARAMVVANREELEIQKREGKRLRLLAALSLVDFEAKHRTERGKRHPGTGEWLLKHHKYMRWKASNSSSPELLCCHGIPGSGKTISASIVIEDLSGSESSGSSQAIYFYCDYADHRTLKPVNIFNAWLKQLYLRGQISEDIQEKMVQSYVSEVRAPEEQEVRNVLCSVLEQSPGLYIVLDGLDECERMELVAMLDFLARLESMNIPALRILVLCRDENVVVQSLIHYNQIQISAALLADDIDAIVRDFVSSRLRDGSLKLNNQDLGHEIVSELTTKAKGMFLWVSFQLDELCEMVSDDEIRKTLRDLPEGLSATYARILRRISATARNRDLAGKVFRWVVCATRPLSIEELKEAVAFKPYQESLNFDQIPNGDLMMRNCRGLVVRENNDAGTVRFAHQTVQQYLLSVTHSSNETDSVPVFQFSRREADIIVGILCITYLSFSDFETQVTCYDRGERLQPDTQLKANALTKIPATLGISKSLVKLQYRANGGTQSKLHSELSPTVYSRRPTRPSGVLSPQLVDNYRLLDYVVQNWEYHTRAFPLEEQKPNQVLYNLAMNKHLPFNFRPWGPNQHFGRGGCPQCEAYARCGLEYESYGKSLPYLSLMHYAAEVGNLPLIKPLREEYCIHERWAPETLVIACQHSQLDVVRYLMGSFEFDLSDIRIFDAPAKSGHASVLRYLLTHVSEDLAESHMPRLMGTAVRAGHSEVVELLCEQGALRIRQDGRPLPLHIAASEGHEGVTRTLIKFGASVRTVYDGMTALSRAALRGHTSIVAILLDCDKSIVDERISAAGECPHQTALHLAATKGHDKVVLQLARAGGCLTLPDAHNRSPLDYAIAGEHLATLRVMLEDLMEEYNEYLGTERQGSITDEDLKHIIYQSEVIENIDNTKRTEEKRDAFASEELRKPVTKANETVTTRSLGPLFTWKRRQTFSPKRSELYDVPGMHELDGTPIGPETLHEISAEPVQVDSAYTRIALPLALERLLSCSRADLDDTEIERLSRDQSKPDRLRSGPQMLRHSTALIKEAQRSRLLEPWTRSSRASLECGLNIPFERSMPSDQKFQYPSAAARAKLPLPIFGADFPRPTYANISKSSGTIADADTANEAISELRGLSCDLLTNVIMLQSALKRTDNNFNYDRTEMLIEKARNFLLSSERFNSFNHGIDVWGGEPETPPPTYECDTSYF